MAWFYFTGLDAIWQTSGEDLALGIVSHFARGPNAIADEGISKDEKRHQTTSQALANMPEVVKHHVESVFVRVLKYKLVFIMFLLVPKGSCE